VYEYIEWDITVVIGSDIILYVICLVAGIEAVGRAYVIIRLVDLLKAH
jgi:hypothetical protein